MQTDPTPKSGRTRLIVLTAAALATAGCAAFLVHAATSEPQELADVLVLDEPTDAPPEQAANLPVTYPTRKVTVRRTFSDTFKTLNLAPDDDSPGWKTHFPFTNAEHWAGRTLTGNREQQIYVDPAFKGSGQMPLGLNPFSVSADGLVMSAQRIPPKLKDSLTFQETGKDGKTKKANFQYMSGLLTTKNSFSQLYGYFEVNADIPRDRAAWSGLWMLPQAPRKGTPEIDVMEVNNRQPERRADEGTMALHYNDAAGKWSHTMCYVQLQPGFHRYGALWTPERITYYTDRKPVCSVKTPASVNEPLYLILQLGIGPNVDQRTPDTVTMKVRWVSAYQIAP